MVQSCLLVDSQELCIPFIYNIIIIIKLMVSNPVRTGEVTGDRKQQGVTYIVCHKLAIIMYDSNK